MKKPAILFILLVGICGFTQAQPRKWKTQLGLASGFGYPSGLPSPETSGVSTVVAGVDYYLNPWVSTGLYAGYTYQFAKFNGNSGVDWKEVWKGWDAGGKLSLHFAPLFPGSKLDIYLTAFGGISERKLRFDKDNIYNPTLNRDTSDFTFGGMLGASYPFSPRWGVYGNAGYSRELFLGAGVIYRFGKLLSAKE